MATRARGPGKRTRGARSRPGRGTASTFRIPFEYAATFELTGQPGRLVEDVINISVEGGFVATSIAYGLEEDRGRDVDVTQGLVGGALGVPFRPDNVRLGLIPLEALVSGFRASPGQFPLVFRSRSGAPEPRDASDLVLNDEAIPAARRGRAFQAVRASSEVSFMFSMVDSASGRELQKAPTLSVASLGKANGERPFRSFARPLSFQPRSTIRLQIVELLADVRGTLFVSLGGYKVLDLATGADPSIRDLIARTSRNGSLPGPSESKTIPFDHVATFDLTGRPGNRVEAEVPLSAGAGFVATHLGYGVVPDAATTELRLGLDESEGAPPVDLNALALSAFPSTALVDGFRIRPELLRAVIQPGGMLATVPPRVANRAFESLNRSESVSFRYEIHDTATGRALQNQAVHNVAGLGIADGNRPFKRLAFPMVFLPRSTIRVDVLEHFGRGRLFIAFQGYKRLG